MKIFIKLIILSALLVANNLDELSKSVVKIYSKNAISNYKFPYQTNKISSYVGTGVIIEGNQILTTAHLVEKTRLLEVKKENDTKKYICFIKYISYQADLAMLSVDLNNSFFKNTKPLKLSSNVKVRDKVTVIGYPLGGKNVSFTTGVVSRIEQQYYPYSANKLLSIQIDAAINPGNSGGAAVNNKNELIGIVMSKKLKAENIGYIIPTEIIKTFLIDIKDGKVDGFKKDSTYFAFLTNSALKEYFGLKEGESGVILDKISKYEKKLRANDIILKIDGKKIANDGTILTKYGRITFDHIFHTKQIGDFVELEILRDKKVRKIKYKIKKEPELVPYEFGKEPRYIIYGGFVFTPITKNYLFSITKLESSFIQKKLYSLKKTNDFTEAITIAPTVFPDYVNRGYSVWGYILKSVNGIKIKNLKHLAKVLDNLKDKYSVFKSYEDKIIVLDTQKAKNSFKTIKFLYRLNNNRYLGD